MPGQAGGMGGDGASGAAQGGRGLLRGRGHSEATPTQPSTLPGLPQPLPGGHAPSPDHAFSAPPRPLIPLLHSPSSRGHAPSPTTPPVPPEATPPPQTTPPPASPALHPLNSSPSRAPFLKPRPLPASPAPPQYHAELPAEGAGRRGRVLSGGGRVPVGGAAPPPPPWACPVRWPRPSFLHHHVRGRGGAERGVGRWAEPAEAEREAGPGRGAEEAGQEAEGEGDWPLAGPARGEGGEAARGGRVLPRPLELRQNGEGAGSAGGEAWPRRRRGRG